MFSKRLAMALSAAAMVTGVTAVTSISDANMTEFLSTGALDLATMYAPMWFFGQALHEPPCIPTWTFSGTPDTPDIYDPAHQTKAAPQCMFPNVGCGCRNPGVPIGNPTPAFPIYYTFGQCNGGNEVRVVYNLFFQKDGASVAHLVNTGHDYDWERVIIVHTKDTKTNTWAPSEALYSAHRGYNRYKWGEIQNTLSTAEIHAGKAKSPQGQKNQDHPKVYNAWSKHPNFDNKNTGFNDPIAQSLDKAFRSDDWWHYVEPQHYILADRSTVAGKAISSANWGTGATSNPPAVQDSLCSQ